MRTGCAAAPEFSKFERSKTYPSKGNKLRKILPFELFLREIWPEERSKAKSYMRLTGAKESTAKLRIRGKHPPDYAEIAAILRSEHGLEFIKHVLGDERPSWFVGFERAKNIGDTRKLQAQLSRRIAQLEMQVE